MENKEAYITWKEGDERGMAKALAQVGNALNNTEPIIRTRSSDLYSDILPNTSVRDGFDRRDYEAFRPGEAIPIKMKETIAACMRAYNSVGIVRNIIDLMGDFACQGIGLSHPNERIEKFYREWFKKVDGVGRSERFLNLLYRCGNVIVKRRTAKLTSKDETQLKRAIATPDMDIEEEIKLQKREVPWRYSFMNPLMIEVLGEELVPFIGQEGYVYSIKIPDTLARKVQKPRTPEERAIVDKIPTDIKTLILLGNKTIPLDPDKVSAFYYKKDDWTVWAYPMISSVLADLNLLQKMKLADLAALDGAISSIRVWKLGDLKQRILPTNTTIQRLATMLNNNVGGGVMDLIWGPEIDLQETSTEIHRFLGNTKYESTLASIYAGLGVPPTLTGAATASGFTNNYISLKTLIERLEYGRSVLRQFWEQEVRLVQRAMGFRFPAVLTFDRMTLSDEASERALLIQLLDRNGIALETLQDMFGLTPEIEEVRIRREQRKRKAKQIPPKASPILDEDHDLLKLFVQTGVVTPSEVGLELKEKKSGEMSPAEIQSKLAPKTEPAKPKGVPGQGRPKNKKDGAKRKTKVVKPRTSAVFLENFVAAETLQTQIDKLVKPAYLKSLSKTNMRELTDLEAQKFESFKFGILFKFNPNQSQTISKELMKEVLITPVFVPEKVKALLKATVNKFVEKNGKEPPLEVLRRFQAGIYALYRGKYNGNEDGAGEEGSDIDNGSQEIL